MEHNTDEIEIDIRDLYLLLKKNFMLLIFAASLTGLLTGLASRYILPKQYESTVKLYVAKASSSNISISSILSNVSSNDYTELAVVRPLVEEVIERLELDETYESMLEKINVQMPASYILKITVTYDDAKTAMLAANEMAEVVRQGIAEVVGIEMPQVIERGITPTEPASPNVSKNILLGVLLGGMGMAVILAARFILMENREDEKEPKGSDFEKALQEEADRR